MPPFFYWSPSIVTQATEFELTGTITIFGQLFDVPVTGGQPTAAGDMLSVTLTGIAVPKVAPVPLPAGALLMLGVFGAFGVMRKRKAQPSVP